MATWKSVRLPQNGIPHLLVKAHLDKTGYTIHLTDLSRIWSETLTKREIERRAIKEDCSIDPGEDAEQYSILLEKLRTTLTQQDDTTLDLKSTQQDDGLLLELSALLPHPLQPLKWNVRLALHAQAHIATELVHPLIRLAGTQQTQIQHLVHELGEKDRIIAKLSDRLETSGNDLTTVFPGVSHVKLKRNLTQREQLARHVKGLGDFDEEGWRAHVRDSREGEMGSWDVEGMETVLADLPEVLIDHKVEQAQEWWKELHGTHTTQTSKAERTSLVNDGTKKGSSRPNPVPAEEHHETAIDTNESFDQDFQRQGTPPHLKRSNGRPLSVTAPQAPSSSPPAPHQAPVRPEDESTEDESDLDAPVKRSKRAQPTRSSIPTRQRSATPKVSREGSSTSAKYKPTSSPTQDHTSSQQPAPKPRCKLGAIGGNPKASATPSPEPGPGPEAMEVDTAPAPSKPRAKLGKIGGKFKAPTPPPQEEAPTISNTASPAKRHGLGTIGGRKPKQPNNDPITSDSRHASETPSMMKSTTTTQGSAAIERKSRSTEQKDPVKQPTPPLRETSQERADKKRQELKRQLDEKAKAVGTKKKRKF